jgi:trans-2-enoyl-CoA reductase
MFNQQGDNEVLVGEEPGIPFRYQGSYVVDSSSYNPSTDYKNVYVLNVSTEGAKEVAEKVNNNIKESGYTYRNTDVWITPKRKGDVAYRLNGDTSSYDLFSNNCATVTIDAIKEALGNSDIIVNKDNIAKLLSTIQPATVEDILIKDYKTYHGEGTVKEIQRGKRL